jgi:hypothetical protein
MGQVKLTKTELARVAAICRDLDPATHDLTRRYVDAIEPEPMRDRVAVYLRACLRAELLGGLLLRTVCSSARELGMADMETTEQLLLDDAKERTLKGRTSRMWTFDLGYLRPEANSLEALFAEGRPAFAALLDIACSRMFPEELEAWHQRQVESGL